MWFLISLSCLQTKIQQTKMLVTCQRFCVLFLFGLVWQYSSIQKNIIKVGSKSWIHTCSCHITLSLPFYTYPASKRELNFHNGYLSLLYFCLQMTSSHGQWYVVHLQLFDYFFNKTCFGKTCAFCLLSVNSCFFFLSTKQNN